MKCRTCGTNNSANGIPCNPTDSPVTYTTDTLTAIADKAYWVHSSIGTSIKVNISAPSVGAQTLPPSVNLVAGWNLVPVLSLTESTMGVSISADSYFSGLDWNQAMGYDTPIGTFTTLFPLGLGAPGNSGANLIVGQGYYVYMEAAGTIVP